MNTSIPSKILLGSLAACLSSCVAMSNPGGHTTGLAVQSVGAGGQVVSVEGAPLQLKGLDRGESRETSLLGLFSWGDSSMDAAAKAGNLESVRYIDRQVFHFLGIFATYTTVVLGKKSYLEEWSE